MLQRCAMGVLGQIKVNSAVPGASGPVRYPCTSEHSSRSMNHTVKLLKLGLDTYDRVQSKFPILVFDAKISWSS